MQAPFKPVLFAMLLGLSLLGGCKFGHETPAERIQKAKDFEAKQDYHASVIELKSALQQEPNNAQARWLLGLDYLKLNQGGDAETQLEKAVQLGISPASARIPLAKAWLLKGDYGKVLDKLAPSDKDDPQTLAQILQIRGDALMGQGKYTEACPLYGQSLKADATYVPAYWGQARCEFGNGHPDQAVATAQKAANMDSARLESWYLLGDLYRASNQPDKALGAYDQALKVKPKDFLALSLKATTLLSLNRMDEGVKAVQALKQAQPKSLTYQYLQAYVDFRQKKYGDAKDLLQQILQVDPNHLQTLLLYGTVNYATGDNEIALDSFNHVLTLVDLPAARTLAAATQVRMGLNANALKTLAPLLGPGQTDPKPFLLAGQAAMNQGRYQQAMTYLGQASKLDPQNAAIRTSLAQSQLLNGDQQGVTGLESVITSNPQDAQAYLALVAAQLAKGDSSGALSTINRMAKAQPKNPMPYYFKGQILLAQRNVPGARQAFDQSLALDAAFLPAATALAELDLAQNQPDQAKQRFQNILGKDPNNLGAQLGLAGIYLSLNDVKSYVAQMKTILQAHPDELTPVSLLDDYYLRNKQPQAAIDLARKASQSHPGNAAFLDHLGQTLLLAGRYNDAVDAFTNLTNLQPSAPVAWYRLGAAQRMAGDLNGSQQSLQKALRLAPNYLDARIALAGLDMAQGQTRQALDEVKRIQADAPQSPIGYNLEADIYTRLKQPAQALQAYQKAFQVAPSDQTAIAYHGALLRANNTAGAEQMAQQWLKQHANDVAFRLYLANNALIQKQQAQAIALYRQIVQLAPDNILALNNLASLLQKQNDPGAMAYAQRAYQLQSRNPLVADTYGWLLAQQGKSDQALPLLDQAVKGAPQFPGPQYHLAAVLVKLGKTTEARPHLQAALASKEPFSERSEATQLLRQIGG